MTKTVVAKSKDGYMVYFPGAPLRKVAHRSVSSSKTVRSLQGRRVLARKSSPKNKPWSTSTYYSLSLSDSDSYHSTSSSPSCCSSVASNASSLFLETPSTPTWSSNSYLSLSVSDHQHYSNNQSSHSDDSSSESYSTTDSTSTSTSTFQSSGSSNHPSPMLEQPTLYVLCKLVNGVLVKF